MRRYQFKAIVLLGLAHSVGCAQEAVNLESETDRISYSLGHQAGTDFQRQGLELDPALLRRGIEDGLAGTQPLLQQDAMDALLLQLKQDIVEEQREQLRQRVESRRAKVQEKRAAGSAFLAANAKKPGVKTLPSGLQYLVIEAGKGGKPTSTDTVTLRYRGTRIDGSEFDSSDAEPATYRVDEVIGGWTEALQLMQEGDRWQLFIPPKLGYGERGAGKIPANSALIFEVELLSVDTE